MSAEEKAALRAEYLAAPRADNWVDRSAPVAFRPYLKLMRADKPIGTWLLFLPCVWGIGMGTFGGGPLVSGGVSQDLWADPRLILLFAIGAFIMRGAGCAINDILDRDIDAKVERTKTRPLPAGDLNVKQALLFLGILCLIGLMVLLQLNLFSIVLGASSLILVGTYPLMKRVTWWPQLFLGFTFNWGALLGYSAVAGHIGPAALLLYGAGILWTLGYDTIYAHQDREDDAMVGVKSSALKLGEKTKPFVAACYTLMLLLIAAGGAAVGMYLTFYLLLGIAALHALWQILALNIHDAEGCLKLFKSNRDLGLLIALAILTGKAFPLGVLG
ncbi:MAG: 4-hydroxybenzoate octaprenyltransferase [Alphaproteobacteria bacterium]